MTCTQGTTFDLYSHIRLGLPQHKGINETNMCKQNIYERTCW